MSCKKCGIPLDPRIGCFIEGCPSSNKAQAAAPDPVWPTHANGQPKRVGELTIAEQDAQVEAAIRRLRPEFARLGASYKARAQ